MTDHLIKEGVNFFAYVDTIEKYPIDQVNLFKAF